MELGELHLKVVFDWSDRVTWLRCDVRVSLVTFTATAKIGGGAKCHELNASGVFNTTSERRES